MRRFIRTELKVGSAAGVAALVLGLLATPPASAQQSLSLSVGGFVPLGTQTSGGTLINGRTGGDVLAANVGYLDFNLKDFNGATFNGEYIVGLGNYFDAGVGVGYYSKTVPSVYTAFVNANGSEIEQDLALRVVPFSATFRVLPAGQHHAVIPYVGAGVGVFRWRYRESGEFVDLSDSSIFANTYTADGTVTGPVLVFGVRVPVDNLAFGFEMRSQYAKANLPADQGFAGNTIDLGGNHYMFTVNVRF